MNIDTALKNINELLVEQTSIPMQLTLSQGLDPKQAKKLLDTMDFLIAHYQGKDSVPKSLANAFVNINRSIESACSFYDDELQDAIYDLSDKILAKVYQLFDQ